MQKESAPDLRLVALDRALRERKKSRRWLGLSIGRGPNAVQKWVERQYWPGREEQRIEALLALPGGFFAQIAAGRPYEEALAAPADDENSQIVSQLTALLRADPTRPVRLLRVGARGMTMRHIQAHLREQIGMFFDLAMPDGTVSPEGLREARELLHDVTPPKK